MFRCLVLCVCWVLVAGVLRADPIQLTLRKHAATPYMAELLEWALENAGHPTTITIVDLPPKRYNHYVAQGEAGYVAFKNQRREMQGSIRIDVPLTGELIGKRVVFVRRDGPDIFAHVETLEDLRRSGAVGAFGDGWFDAQVWEANGLPFALQSGDWRSIYQMLASGNRSIDYFSRGILEMSREAALYPDLMPDPHLLIVYPGDFNFFLSASLEDQAETIQHALEAAISSGLRDRLLRKHFPQVYDPAGLNIHGRRQIDLALPGADAIALNQ